MKIIIMGCGRVGARLAEALSSEGNDVTIIELEGLVLFTEAADDGHVVFVGVILEAAGKCERLQHRYRFFVMDASRILHHTQHIDPVALDCLHNDGHFGLIQKFI